jgi:hypothetical protein
MPDIPHTVLSIDLALTSYRDVGIALVRSDADGTIHARAAELPLDGRPTVAALVAWIEATCRTESIACIAIDGPSAWRASGAQSTSTSPHARAAEAALHTPGKTGLPPNGVKPSTYLGFTQLSVDLFATLASRGWTFPHELGVVPPRLLVETFPTAAWRGLRVAPLPGKAKARRDAGTVPRWLEGLAQRVPLHAAGVATHDQLQAVVGGIAPAWWMAGLASRVALRGAPAFLSESRWYEGFIIVPDFDGNPRLGD